MVGPYGGYTVTEAMRRANASPHQFIGSQSTIEANPTSGMLGVQYGVRSTDAHVGRVLHCHESPYSIVGVLGLTVTPPRRGANASRRRCGGSQSTVGPHPSLGCLRYSMECVSRACSRFSRRHEPLAAGALLGALCDGDTATEA